jgi:hypothetical protein
MKRRCLDKNNKAYGNYGGRGITICERWKNFENFISDMGRRPSEKHSIDRINNDGNYQPSNCRCSQRVCRACRNARSRASRRKYAVLRDVGLEIARVKIGADA